MYWDRLLPRGLRLHIGQVCNEGGEPPGRCHLKRRIDQHLRKRHEPGFVEEPGQAGAGTVDLGAEVRSIYLRLEITVEAKGSLVVQRHYLEKVGAEADLQEPCFPRVAKRPLSLEVIGDLLAISVAGVEIGSEVCNLIFVAAEDGARIGEVLDVRLVEVDGPDAESDSVPQRCRLLTNAKIDALRERRQAEAKRRLGRRIVTIVQRELGGEIRSVA